MGAATACFLARDHGASVTVLERDPLYTRASSALSASSIRQQFSQPVNIALSTWSLNFLRRVGDELAFDEGAQGGGLLQHPQIGLVEPGYLYLAGASQARALEANHQIQRQHGADVALLDPAALARRFPWMSTADLHLASLGLSGEGWFDGPGLLGAFKRKAQACGVRFVKAQATHFGTQAQRVQRVFCADGAEHAADALVLCGGAWTPALAQRLGVALPVVAKKRDVFVFESPAATPQCPLVIDPSGLWFRPEGQVYLCGAPPRDGDPDEPPLTAIDHAQFDEQLWPLLAQRVPGFEALRLRSAWAGYYEMNLFDHNGLAGALPGWDNVYTACGFSGHGMQQSPAVGSALAAMVAGGTSSAPSLLPLSPKRLFSGQRLLEANVI